MKALKKISLVYFLQIIAVVLLFSYRDASPANEKNDLLMDKVFPGQINKPNAVNNLTDSLVSSKINNLPKVYSDKNW
jgi:hypothetical protein